MTFPKIFDLIQIFIEIILGFPYDSEGCIAPLHRMFNWNQRGFGLLNNLNNFARRLGKAAQVGEGIKLFDININFCVLRMKWKYQ